MSPEAVLADPQKFIDYLSKLNAGADLVQIYTAHTFMELIDFILHVDEHLLEFIKNYGVWIYAILFLIIFENVTFNFKDSIWYKGTYFF